MTVKTSWFNQQVDTFNKSKFISISLVSRTSPKRNEKCGIFCSYFTQVDFWSRLFLKIQAMSSSLRIDISLPHWKWAPPPYEGVLPKSFSSKMKQHANRVAIKHWGSEREDVGRLLVDVFSICASWAVLGLQYSPLFGYTFYWSLLSRAP